MEHEQADFSDAKISFSADVNSINTGNEQRDGHLKSNDFFNAEQFPSISFASTSFNKLSDDKYELKGDFTMRDVTKPVTLQVDYNGQMTDPYGNTKAGFEINGSVLRKDFGLSWDAATETGGVVVSNEVKLHLNIQMVLAK
jgi:polyisoprenoid-binding protein YceI